LSPASPARIAIGYLRSSRSSLRSFVIALHVCACLVYHVATPVDGAAAEDDDSHPYVRSFFCAVALFSGEPGAGGLHMESRSAMLVGSFLMFVGAWVLLPFHNLPLLPFLALVALLALPPLPAHPLLAHPIRRAVHGRALWVGRARA
jgi:hypothetical protein